MRSILLTLLLSPLLFSYQQGDTLSQNIQDKLNIKEEKIYIIDFFASWCASCEKEIPYISKVHQQVDSSQVEIIGVDVDKKIENAEAFQKELKERGALTFRVVNDPENSIIKAFKPIGMPALFYIKDKKVIDAVFGAVDNIDEVIIADLKRLQK
ncbi:MAG: TlpA family protein disulfide reductase [Epsilonproteobacteria bacterium]|nr:MAG: TlpA family protein disulfide reductase [Campylobacterota bacterium]